jgi:lipid-binding SYLF domain-containing protein
MRSTSIVSIPLLALVALAGCATAPTTPGERQDLKAEAGAVLHDTRALDPFLGTFLDRSHAYVVFPRVGKGAWIVGGGYGRGIVYRQGAPVGYADITQMSVGLQVGGQAYTEILVFESPADLQRFIEGRMTLTANASAVIVKTGAAAQTRYTDGVAVFLRPIGGAMVEASVGGQQFSYVPE